MRGVLNLGEVVAAHARFQPQKIGARDSRRTLTDLERGDQLHVTTRTWNGRMMADAIVVTRSISGDARSSAGGQVRGTIRYIDTSARTIELGGASWAQGFNPAPGGNSIVIGYDSGTIMEYQGRRYGIANLEAGDVVDMDIADRNAGRPVARRIVVAKGS